MPQRIPISAARTVGQKYDCRQVILLAWDGELTHIVTWGKTLKDCSYAAEGGNRLKEKWGWPESNDQPSRVRRLQDRITELEQHNIALLKACQTVEEYLNGLEDATESDDPLKAIRRHFHAPLHRAIDAGLNFRTSQGANAEEPQSVESVQGSANKKESSD
jgi:hypothetical protein